MSFSPDTLDIEAIRRVARYRHEFSKLKLSVPARKRGRLRRFEIIFESSLIVEPDGCGLPCVIEAATEILVDLGG